MATCTKHYVGFRNVLFFLRFPRSKRGLTDPGKTGRVSGGTFDQSRSHTELLRRFLWIRELPEPDAEALTSCQHCMLHCMHYQFSHRVPPPPVTYLTCFIFFLLIMQSCHRSCWQVHLVVHVRFFWSREGERGEKFFFLEKEVQQKCIATHSNREPKQVPTFVCICLPFFFTYRIAFGLWRGAK